LSSANQNLACVVLVLCALHPAQAQVASQANSTAQPDSAQLEQVPRVPGVSTLWRGFNAGVTFSAVHDSTIGWYNVVTPAVSYTFSPHFSADVSASIYPYRLVEVDQATTPPTVTLVESLGEAGDTLIGLHAAFQTGLLRSTTTAYVTAPSGDQSAGLGAGKATYDFSDRVERYVGKAALLLDIGVGDSSSLFNNLVTRDYNSVGTLAHFQEGVAVWLPGRSYIQSVAYEQVPFGSQTIFAAQPHPGAPPPPPVTTSSIAKDNGVTTYLGIPLTTHLELSGYYNRSLPEHDDTVSFGVTYVLRGTLKGSKESMIDRALREAEQGAPQQ
jgi:hypothetical protein